MVLFLSQDAKTVEAASSVAAVSATVEVDTGILKVPVSEAVHRRGINIRHIGLLRSLVLRHQPTRDALLIEIVARSLKAILRSWLREGAFIELIYCTVPATLTVNRGCPLCMLVARTAMVEFGDHETSMFAVRSRLTVLLNLVSGHLQRSKAFWSETLCSTIAERYGRLAPVSVLVRE